MLIEGLVATLLVKPPDDVSKGKSQAEPWVTKPERLAARSTCGRSCSCGRAGSPPHQRKACIIGLHLIDQWEARRGNEGMGVSNCW